MNNNNQDKKCPVCGTDQSTLSSFKCAECSFAFSYVVFWADEISKEHWLKAVDEYKINYLKEKNNKNNYISISRDSVSLLSTEKHEVITVYGDGRKPEIKKDVLKIVENDNNSILLFTDNSVGVYGDNTFGQCNIGAVKDINLIALSSTCAFLVTAEGKVNTYGSLPDNTRETVAQWDNIVDLVVSDSLIISRDNNGKIRVAEVKAAPDTSYHHIEEWNNVKKLCVQKDCCVALLEDGSVLISKEGELAKELQSWENIKDIVYDGTYVVGLTQDNQIRMAGKCKSAILEAGRKAAAKWENMVAICCSNYAFAGYDTEGNLHLAGKFGGKAEKLIEEWKEYVVLS